jgi:hypothetical protein
VVMVLSGRGSAACHGIVFYIRRYHAPIYNWTSAIQISHSLPIRYEASGFSCNTFCLSIRMFDSFMTEVVCMEMEERRLEKPVLTFYQLGNIHD